MSLLGATDVRAQATRTWVSGVGDDANPCSRTAPCKTFAGTISKTAAKGEINVLDPGGFGAVTITKAITISAEGFEAGILVGVNNGVQINAGVNDVVVLRGLDFEGLGLALSGINFLSGKALHIEDCTINGFNDVGIKFKPSGMSDLYVKDTVVRNASGAIAGARGGILIAPTGGGMASASLDNVRIENTENGLRVEDNAQATVRNSVAAGNMRGFAAVSNAAPAELNLESSVSTSNTVGVRSVNPLAIVRMSNTMVTGNATGLSAGMGSQIVSFGNNRIAGNTSDGMSTSTQPQQ